MAGYLKYVTSMSGTRPPFRNYTVRELRPEAGELDVDFVSHGDFGIAGPWAATARPGEQVALIDQGRGFDPVLDARHTLLVGDESALPAIAGILRDLPRTAVGTAYRPLRLTEADLPGADDRYVRTFFRIFRIQSKRDYSHHLPESQSRSAHLPARAGS